MTNALSVISRVSILIAALCVGLGVLERVAFAAGYTILRGSLTGSRLFEIAAILVVFVIAILLRQIRDQLRESS